MKLPACSPAPSGERSVGKEGPPSRGPLFADTVLLSLGGSWLLARYTLNCGIHLGLGSGGCRSSPPGTPGTRGVHFGARRVLHPLPGFYLYYPRVPPGLPLSDGAARAPIAGRREQRRPPDASRILGNDPMKPVLRLLAAVAAAAIAGGAHAQAPEVLKVDPPNWRGGHSINPVRLLIPGDSCFRRWGGITLGSVRQAAGAG